MNRKGLLAFEALEEEKLDLTQTPASKWIWKLFIGRNNADSNQKRRKYRTAVLKTPSGACCQRLHPKKNCINKVPCQYGDLHRQLVLFDTENEKIQQHKTKQHRYFLHLGSDSTYCHIVEIPREGRDCKQNPKFIENESFTR